MTEGVIYLYTSPSGKHYVGQTTNESQKTIGKSAWNISNCLNGKIKEAYGFIWKFK